MAKAKTQYICNECGSVFAKWSGQCDNCGAWNSLSEEKSGSHFSKVKPAKPGKRGNIEFTSLNDKITELPKRMHTGIDEFDRVLGGGLVPGSATLLGGDPGIGKSTLLLQIVCALGAREYGATYITGEEGVDQVMMRAKRLGANEDNISLASATNVGDILASLPQNTKVLIIDSIQTMFLDSIESAPGTVSQVRGASHELITHAKKNGIAILLIGHVTKDGQIAGPKLLEHMVDTVLYCEGDRGHHFRILRSVKNRFGAVNEIGVFEMQEGGMVEVKNPSALFLDQRQNNTPGSAVLAAVEGTRPVLVEVQALVAQSVYASPKRSVVGWDLTRLSMLLAVLESRCGYVLSGSDVYLNIAGGLKITETGADLAIAAAIISALLNKSLDDDVIFFGEVGLAGEVRSIRNIDMRVKEAEKMGFKRIIGPNVKLKGKGDFQYHSLKTLSQLQQFL